MLLNNEQVNNEVKEQKDTLRQVKMKTTQNLQDKSKAVKEIQSNIGYFKKTGKNSKKQSNLIPNGARK